MVLQQGYKNIGGYKMEDMTSKGFDPDVEDIDNSDVNEYNEREILVAKRKGTYETFKVGKLADSIFAAAAEVGGEDLQIADDLATEIQDMLESNDINIIEASDLHDMVYKCLVDNKHAATSERYLTESIKRSNQREMDTALMKSFEEITFKSEEDSEVKRENANIDSSTAMGTMLKYGSEAAKNFNLLYLMTPDVANAHRNGDIHIHDLDFLSLTETCMQIPLDKLFDGGFNTGHGYLRQPGSIRAAAAQAAIAIQSDQNDQHGGQSIPLFDYYLAPYVALTYVKQIAHIAKIKFDLNKEKYHELKHRLVDYQKEHRSVMNEQGYSDINDILVQFCEEFKVKASEKRLKKVMKDAYDDTYYDTYQAMEAFIHNLNTMHCLPASEKIWVLDVKTNNLTLMTMEALDSVFEPKRFKVISLNKKTGKAEFKFITKSQRKDNQRKLVKLKDNQGRAVRVTDNHKLMTMDGIKISEKLPKDCEYTLSPRGIDFPPVKYDMCVSDFGKPRKDNAFQNDHVIVSEAFAEFMGYYMGDGCILGQTSTCCISACGKVTFEYMEDLLKRAFGCEFRTSYTYFNHSKEGKTEKDIRIQLGMPLARMIASKFGRIGKEKHIPVEILMGPREVRIAFLKAYFAMDGRKDAKYSELSTCTEVLQKQVALMLSSLGVSPHYGETIIDGNRKVFFVSLSAHDSYECGLKDSDETAFQIPKYDLSMVYDAYKKECDDITGRRTSHRLRYNELEELIDEHDAKDVMHLRNVFINNIESTEDESSGDEYVYDISVEDNETFLTKDCIFVHNSRAGAQVPFSSINYGTDTSTEGRMVMETILKSTWDGLGNGEIPIFPIQIFKLKAGVSYNKEDPNYDLFELSCKVSAKRLYPNFVNLDAPYNAELYVPGHPETEMATMGCRTRVSTNKHDLGKQVIPGRGNLSFTSINLPRLAIMSNGDIDKFYKLLDNRLELVHKQLLQRFELQCLKHPINYPFLMGQGVWIGSDLLGPNDDIRDILKNGTLGVGFIGLAETLTSLIGEHHGQSERAEKLGLEIIQHMRDYTDAWSENEHMNYGVIGTPAEGLSGRFVRMDKKKFGVIPGVTDKEYYTNSSHIPVSFPISATKKIQLEAPFHAIENGGHILYIEMDGDPTKNVGAFMKVVRYMHDNNAGYFAINHPVDRDPVCNYTGIIDDVCPRCGRKEGEPMTMEMWKRIHQTAGAGNICTCGACGDPNEEADRISNAIDTSDLKFDFE